MHVEHSKENKMKKLILTTLFMSISLGAVADICPHMQMAEANIVSIAYYGGNPSEARSFCYEISKAVNSKEGKNMGIDGLLMGSLEFCAKAKGLDTKVLATEVSTALKSVDGCYSLMGE